MRLTEATDPEAYARRLLELIAELGTISGTAEAAMIGILEDARRTVLDQILALDFDSPTAGMLSRALQGIDEAMATLASRTNTLLATNQTAAQNIGVKMATEPPGFETAAASITIDQLHILQGFSADLVQGVTAELRKRINAELTSVMVGAKTPTQAATAIGRNLTDRNHFSTIAHRARAIVVTEVGRAQSLGTQAAQQALQDVFGDAGDPTVVRKQWLNAHLPGARATHLQAEANYRPGGNPGPIPVRDLFTVGGFKALYPKDPSLPPSESVHCHCVTLTVFDEGTEQAAAQTRTKLRATYTKSRRAATAD